MEIIGHRGSSHTAPENTLAAFQLGWTETTTCELDLRSTLDGKLVVIHDASTKRTTGVGMQVAKHSLADLQKLDAGSWKRGQWKDQKLPALAEVLSIMPEQKRLLIEIKAGPEIVPELARVIMNSGKEKQVQLQSFSFPLCVEARKTFSFIPVYQLVAFRRHLLRRTWAPTLPNAIARARDAKLDGINVNDVSLLNAKAIGEIHSAGLKIHIWTVDRIKAAKRLKEWGVDGIITNRPGWLKAQLQVD